MKAHTIALQCRKETETAEHIEQLNGQLNLERLRREELEGLLSQARDRILELLAEVGPACASCGLL